MRTHFLPYIAACSLGALAWACSSSPTTSKQPPAEPSTKVDGGRETNSSDSQQSSGETDAGGSPDAGTVGSGSLVEYVPPSSGPEPWFEAIEPPAVHSAPNVVDAWHTRLEHVSDTGDAAIGSLSITSSATQQSGRTLFYWTPEAGSVDIPLPEQLAGLDPKWLKAEALAVAASARKVVIRLTGHGTTNWYIWSEKDGSQLLSPGEDVYDISVDLFSTNNETFAGALRLNDDRVLPFYALGTSVFRVSLGSHTTHTDASAISHNASVIAGNTTIEARSRVYRWELNRGVSILDLPDGYGDCWLSGNAMSDNGAVLTMTCSNDEWRHAFRWTRESDLELLETPAQADAFPTAISADGSTVVGELRQGSSGHVFVHHQDQALTITPPGSLLSYPLWTRQSISADGTVVLGQAQDPEDNARGFFWSRELGAVSLLPLRGHSDTWVSSLSGDGLTIAGHSSQLVAGEMHAVSVIWRGGDKPLSISSALEGAGLRSSGMTFEGSAQVTRLGRHAWGTGTTPDGHHRAWIAHLP